MKSALLSSTLCAAVLLSACGELAYKRGAGADAFQAAQAACRDDAAGMQACMARLGWTRVELDRLNPGVSVMPQLDNRAPARTAAEEDARLDALPPGAALAIASWWKFGGGPEDLVAAQRDCARRLGVAHPLPLAADGVSQWADSAYLQCMRQAGWRGLAAR